MNGDRQQRQPVLSFLAAIGCVLLLGALWVLKPPLPQVSSFTGALSEATFEQLIFFIGWILLSAATLALLYEAVRRIADAPSRRTVREVQRVEQAITPTNTEPTRTLAGERRYRPPLVMTVGAPAGITDGRGALAAEAHQATDVSRSSPGDGTRGGPRLRIRLLGPFTIEGIDLPTGLRSTCKQLIAYLALHPRGAARDELIEALWPEQDPRRGRQRLWQAISDARILLGDALVADDGHYAIDRHNVTVDVEQLEELIAQADAADAPADQLPPLEGAMALFAGDPLTGWDQPWADPDMRRLRSIHAELLARAGHARLVTGDTHGALRAAEQGLRLESLNEGLWRLAMQAEGRLGHRESISKRYDQLRHQLDEQLGLKPEAATTALYHELLGQR